MGHAYGYDPELKPDARQFIAYFYHNGWSMLQLGVHICLSQPNIEIHVPFGFFRIGWIYTPARYFKVSREDFNAALDRVLAEKCIAPEDDVTMVQVS